jgi:hypothetical protein
MSNNATATATFTATGDKNIYAYLGNSDNSTSKYINASLEVTVDGNKIAIPSTSFKEAGMGNCNNRVNYYFVKLGEVKGLADAEHTIVVKGVGSASLNLGLVTLI